MLGGGNQIQRQIQQILGARRLEEGAWKGHAPRCFVSPLETAAGQDEVLCMYDALKLAVCGGICHPASKTQSLNGILRAERQISK